MSKEPRSYVRLDEGQWSEAAALFEAGAANVAALADLFKVSRHTMAAGLKKRGIIRGRTLSEHAKRVAEETATAALGDPGDHAKQAKQAKARHLRLAGEVQDKVATALHFDPDNAMAVMRAKGSMSILDLGMKTLDRAFAAQARILGIHLPEDAVLEMPELVFRVVNDNTIRDSVDQRMRDEAVGDMPQIDPGECQDGVSKTARKAKS